MEERADIMTNEQFWGVVELIRSIIRKSKTTEEAEAEIDRIIESVKTLSPEKTKNKGHAE